MEFVQLSTMRDVYNHHFIIYNKDKTKVTQLVPVVMWKAMYVTYKFDSPNSKF